MPLLLLLLICLFLPDITLGETGDNEAADSAEVTETEAFSPGLSSVDQYNIKALKDELKAEEEFIETTIFDLYLSDKNYGAIVAKYTDDWFQIINIDDALEQLTVIKDREKYRELLSGRIEKTRSIPGTGTIRYELATYHIVIEPAEDALISKELTLTDRLPDPENGFSLSQRFRMAGSGEVDDDLDASFSHRTITSLGKFWSNIDGTVIKGDDYFLGTADLSGIVSDYEINSGLLESPGAPFISSATFAGLSLSTSEDVVLNQESLRGSQLIIYVSSRSRVEFFRGSRLISSQILDFGLQEIDTRYFPQGSYPVDIVFTDDDGTVTKDRQFYTKSSLLTMRNRPVLKFAVGTLRDQLDLLDSAIGYAGADWRVGSAVQLGLGAFQTEEYTIGTGSIVGFWQDFFYEHSLSFDDDNNLGYRSSISGVFDQFSFFLSAQESFGDKDVEEEDEDDDDLLPPDITDPDFPEDEDYGSASEMLDRLNTLDEESSSYSGRISYNEDQLKLFFDTSYSKSGGNDSRYLIGPGLSWTFFSGSDSTLRMYLAIFDSDEGERFESRLVYRYRFSASRLFDTNFSSRAFSDSSDSSLNSTLTLDDKVINDRGTRVRLINEARIQTGDSSQEIVTNSVDVDYADRFSRIQGIVRDRRLSDNDQTALSLNGESLFTLVDGELAVTKPVTQDSFLIVEVTSVSTSSEVEILINNQVAEIVKPGEKAVIGLSPYRSYKASIRPTEDADLISYDTESKSFTLFPGNVVKKTWNVDKVAIAIGTLVNSEGIPMGWQRIRGLKEYVVSEENGFFQAEVSASDKLYIKTEEGKCYLQFPDVPKGEYFTRFGKVPCLKEAQLQK